MAFHLCVMEWRIGMKINFFWIELDLIILILQSFDDKNLSEITAVSWFILFWEICF